MTASPEFPAAPHAGAIHPAVAAALARQGFDALTPVQLAVLEAKAAGRDLLVSAQTGSGKTVAFGLAIAPTLLDESGLMGSADRPLGLIIAPTRELAFQVERELRWLYADAGAVTACCVGGMDMRKERRALEQGAHIVVGTPGRLRDHLTKGSLDLSGIRAVVLDEADEMLDMGFREDLEFILAGAPEERRTLMFSATVPKMIAELARTYQRDALRIVATAASERHADIDYQMIMVQPYERENAIINTLLYFDSGSAIVFCHTREAVKHLAAQLAERGFPVVSLSGELSQSERTSALQAMRDGRSRVCVATDVAARGIDLPNLDLVIHADIPSNPDTLLHRSGRTGRAGRKGVCVLIVPLRRQGAVMRVLDRANIRSSQRGAPTAAEIEARYREQILAAAAASAPPDEAEEGFVAELLARISPERLAAAYLRQQQAARPAPEDISDVSFSQRGTGERGPSTLRDRPKPERRDMTGATWFTLSLGRRNHAEPKWLLPLICRAGAITRDDVGSIRVHDEETRFEISAAKAEEFATNVGKPGSLEKGVSIRPADSAAPAPQAEAPAEGNARPARPYKTPWRDKAGDSTTGKAPFKKGAKPRYKPKGDDKSAPHGAAPRKFKPKSGGKPKGKPKHRPA